MARARSIYVVLWRRNTSFLYRLLFSLPYQWILTTDHSPTHFRDPGGSEDLLKKHTNEGDVLDTNEEIRYSIFEGFVIL